jgi:hypothetical protein
MNSWFRLDARDALNELYATWNCAPSCRLFPTGESDSLLPALWKCAIELRAKDFPAQTIDYLQ